METMDQVGTILEAFDVVGISPSDFIVELLTDHHYINHETVINQRESGQHLVELLMEQLQTSLNLATDVVKGGYAQEVQKLSAKESGYHFSVLNTSIEQLEEFNIEMLGRGMQLHAPMLWSLLLSARGKRHCGDHTSSNEIRVSEDDGVGQDDEALGEDLGDLNLQEMMDGLETDIVFPSDVPAMQTISQSLWRKVFSYFHLPKTWPLAKVFESKYSEVAEARGF